MAVHNQDIYFSCPICKRISNTLIPLFSDEDKNTIDNQLIDINTLLNFMKLEIKEIKEKLKQNDEKEKLESNDTNTLIDNVKINQDKDLVNKKEKKPNSELNFLLNYYKNDEFYEENDCYLEEFENYENEKENDNNNNKLGMLNILSSILKNAEHNLNDSEKIKKNILSFSQKYEKEVIKDTLTKMRFLNNINLTMNNTLLISCLSLAEKIMGKKYLFKDFEKENVLRQEIIFSKIENVFYARLDYILNLTNEDFNKDIKESINQSIIFIKQYIWSFKYIYLFSDSFKNYINHTIFKNLNQFENYLDNYNSGKSQTFIKIESFYETLFLIMILSNLSNNKSDDKNPINLILSSILNVNIYNSCIIPHLINVKSDSYNCLANERIEEIYNYNELFTIFQDNHVKRFVLLEKIFGNENNLQIEELCKSHHSLIENNTYSATLTNCLKDYLNKSLDLMKSKENEELLTLPFKLKMNYIFNLSNVLSISDEKVHAKFEFIKLPDNLIGLYEKYFSIICDECNTKPLYSLICLLCGSKVCFVKNCCNKFGKNKNKYEYEIHAKTCGLGNCIYLSLEGKVYYIVNNNFLNSNYNLYLNKFYEPCNTKAIGSDYKLSIENLNLIKNEFITMKFYMNFTISKNNLNEEDEDDNDLLNEI
jgi:hypothetical protein